ncbi:MAG: transcriptional regulator [Clostridiales bacterium]|nr:MAG: transcriptional regulator [Clostridiales bacterium]
MEILNQYLLKNGIITVKEAEKIGIKRHTLARLVKEKKLERVKNGIYKNIDDILDEYVLVSLNNKVVFSHQTALFLHDLNDRTPNTFHITVPQGYNASHLKKLGKDLIIHYVKVDNFEMGLDTIKSPYGNTVQVYNQERTICDILINKKNIDKQIFIAAISKFFKHKKYNTRMLIKYSRILGIESEVRKYMEIL